MADEDVKQAVKKQFAANAANYVTSEGHAKGDDLALMIEWLQPKPDWVCLDIATGGGHVTKTLAPHVSQVVATDLTPTMLATARDFLTGLGHENLTFVVADAEQLPFLDASFDLVCCRIAPHHFPNPDRFVAEVTRVLRSGGRFVLIDNIAPEDPALDWFMNTVEKLRDPSHVRCPRMSEWRAWLAAAGMTERRSAARRKTHRLPDWLDRVAATPEQRQQVADHLQAASAEARSHFQINTGENGRVLSFQIDDWIALYHK